MAHHPLSFPQAPWGYRIGMPLVVWALPTPARGTFVALSVLLLGVSAALVYILTARLVGDGRAAVAVAVFACSGPGALTVSNPFLVDPAVYVIVAAALILVLESRLVLLAILLVAGVFVHESSLYVLVPAVLLAWNGGGRGSAIRTGATGLPAIVAYLVLHKTSLIVNAGSSHFSYFGELRHVARDELRSGGVKAIVDAVLYSFGAAWVAALLAYRRAPRQVQLLTWILVPLAFSTLLASDWQRVLTWGFPAVVCLTASLAFTWPGVVLFCASLVADTLLLRHLAPGSGKYMLLLGAFVVGATIAYRAAGRERNTALHQLSD